MPIRLSGLTSGLDADAIVKELMTAQNTKKHKVQSKITKLEWKQEKWKELNSKIYSLYTGALTAMKTEGTYLAKKATSTNENKLTVKAGTAAVEGTHKVTVDKLASSQYLTGSAISAYTGADGKETYPTLNTELSELGFDTSTAIRVQVNGSDAVDVAVDGTTTLGDFINGLKDAGLNASYDANYHRIFISSKSSGASNVFSITSGTVSSTAERDNIKTALGYEDLSAGAQKKVDSMIADYRSAAIAGNTEEAEKAIVDFAKNQLTAKITKEATEAYKAGLGEDETADAEALKEAVNTALEAAQDQFDSLETNVTSSLDAYKTAVEAGDFSSSGQTALAALGLSDVSYDIAADGSVNYTFDESSSATLVKGSDAEITYNGAKFTSSNSSFTVNGLSFTATGTTEPGEEITINVSKDVDAVYDKVKNFVKQYNELIKEMNDLYGAASAKAYHVLTDEEKEAMTDDQIAKWEDKIKGSLLRRDDTLGTLISAMRSALQTSVEFEGETYSFANFGITTSTDYKEGGLLHIHGDADDSYGSDFTDKLKKALSDNAEAVMKTLSGVSQKLYATMQDKMKTSSISSALTFYNDKLMNKTMTGYQTEMTSLTDKLKDIEERYYKQFTAMEKSMANLQQQQNSLASYLG